MTGPVVVVGGGVGGLACAIDLALQGEHVILLEQADSVGGKMRQVEVGGRLLDAGPTVFTMRWVFDELFDAAGAALSEHLTLRPAETLARHAWNLDERFDLFADRRRCIDAIGVFAGLAEAQRYAAFCARAEVVYRMLERNFLRRPRTSPIGLVMRAGWRGLPAMLRMSPFATLWSALGDHFHDARLRQLFGRYATYCGSSPFLATAALMLVAHVESEGVWCVDGGMQSVAVALAGLARARGVVQRCGTTVADIVVRDGRAVAVRLASGEVIEAAAIVFNGDSAALRAGLLGNAAVAAVRNPGSTQPSLSAVTWHFVARAEGFALQHHNVFFGADSQREFADLFTRRRTPDDPTVYVCAQDRPAANDARGAVSASTGERLMCLVNAPPCDPSGHFDGEELERCESRMFKTLARCGLEIDRTNGPTPRITTPADFARRFPGSAGTLYGQASHGWMASFRRPGSRTRIPGLYLAGGSVHPGPGVPMAALSGRLAAQSVLADRTQGRASIVPWRRAAMPGGISTR
jgi:1-hydroxycarotenoid 3,4-desaturase